MHDMDEGGEVIELPQPLSCTSFLQIMLNAADSNDFVWIKDRTNKPIKGDLRPAITVPEAKHVVNTYVDKGKYVDADINEKDDCVIY